MDQNDARTTRLQYEKMVDIMETAPEIVIALFKGNQASFWADLVENLYVVGPPIKTAATWKRVWFDYKCVVKKKLRDNKTSLNATGGGPCRTKPLNELEERVANLTNLRATVAGNGAARFGMKMPINETQNDSNSNNQQQNEHHPTTSLRLADVNITEISTNTATNHDSNYLEQLEQENTNTAGAYRTGNRSNRKRKHTEAILQQNKAMLDMMAKHVELQEKTIKLQEVTNNALMDNAKQLSKLNELLTKEFNSNDQK